ncbi:flagellar hook protein FlgE [Sphingosinicella sp. BN140058]|uniref:flagellar hook protein FlgE n=1 Tax=Sphingosinicella sp. BN140058 TaxID=1892855 RepID=UPI00101117BF|nr:flagellar hook protein FlgE [Sphingosinicella sp. BN140058]QAY77288.1 flagellar hook protein FlgE [Sphingosinicella sp. BN140058]
MSLYSALYAGVSGLSAQSSAMAGVADNITNINTVGYKAVQTEFRTLVTDGNAKSSYAAGGVTAAPQSLISKQGMLQSSSSDTDIAIDGAGFFVVRSDNSPGSEVSFTRAGSFKPDPEGFLRNTSGLMLQGWRLDTQGNYVDTGSLDTLEPVRLSDLTGTAMPTSKLEIRANLQSTTPVHAAVTGGTYAAGQIANGTVTPQFTRSIDVYDAQGTAHRVTVGFIKSDANKWQAEVYGAPTDVTNGIGTPAIPGLIAAGQVEFNGDGSLKSLPASFDKLTLGWQNKADPLTIDFNLGDANALNGLTQFGSESALISSIVDGGMLGNLASIEVSKTGRVSAVFDDGTTREVFQLPIATFANPDGLTRMSGNAFQMSANSGNYAINKAGALGAGQIASSSLEASNADLAGEFTNMIRFQRAYSASSKIITTVDDMLQEVSNLKR